MRCTTAFERGAPLTQHTLPRSLPFALPKRLGASEEEVVHAERTAARRTNSAGRTHPTRSDTNGTDTPNNGTDNAKLQPNTGLGEQRGQSSD